MPSCTQKVHKVEQVEVGHITYDCGDNIVRFWPMKSMGSAPIHGLELGAGTIEVDYASCITNTVYIICGLEALLIHCCHNFHIERGCWESKRRNKCRIGRV